MDEDAGMTTPKGVYLQQKTGSWLAEGGMTSFAEPSPAVERSAKSHYMQRRINASLGVLNTVLPGERSIRGLGTLTTPSFQQSTMFSTEQQDRSVGFQPTPQREQPMSVTIMDESGLRDIHLLATPSRDTTLLSPNVRWTEESRLLQSELHTSQIADATFHDHPILQAGLDLMNAFHRNLMEKSNSSQILELLEAMEEACATQIEQLKLLDKPKKMSDILIELKLEHDTWQLARALYSDRLTVEDRDEDDLMLGELSARTDKIIVDDYYSSDADVRQAQLVVDWLEGIASSKLDDFNAKVKYFADSVSWENTVHDLQQGLNNGYIVTEVDPDAPTRQRKHLSDLDEKDELSLAKHLFECIRAGDLEKAQELCLHCGQAWRAATLDGWKLYHDPNLTKDIGEELEAVEGNLSRNLWKLSCWKLSSCSSYSNFERAVYAGLSGNITPLLSVCQTWYDYVWAYFKVMVDVLVEKKLQTSNRYPPPNDFIQEMPKEYWNALLIPELIFQEIEANSSQLIRKQSLNYYHLCQKHLILDSLDGLIEEMYEWLEEGRQCNLHLLRFMAHVVLFIRTVGVVCDESKCNDILEMFIQVLISQQFTELVALYTSYLPKDRQITCYTHLLKGISEPKQQKRCLELANECGLELSAITKEVVENIRLTETEEVPATVELGHELEITEADRHKINVLDWLLYEETQRGEALYQANAVMRGFLATNKHQAALAVFQKIPSDSVDVVNRNWTMKAGAIPLSITLSNDIREFLSIQAYLEAIESFNTWFEHFHHMKPARPPSHPRRDEFTEHVAHEKKMERYQTEIGQWEKQLKVIVAEVEGKVYNVLLFIKGGWMVDEQGGRDDPARHKQMNLLRQLCLPKLCFLLHNVLHSTQNYKKCLQLSDVLASEKHSLYKEFHPNELKHFLHLMHKSASLLADMSDIDPIGYNLA